MSCGFCSAPATLQCSRCALVKYCSAEHQKKHWKTHKKQCHLSSSKAVKADAAMTELGSIINGMSIKDALASLEAAKAEVAKLTAEADIARNAYRESANELENAKKKRDEAKIDVKNVSTLRESGSRADSEDSNDYSQLNFWERRYQLCSGKTFSSSSSSSSSLAHTENELYEWYLSFESLFPLILPDIRSILNDDEWVGNSINSSDGNPNNGHAIEKRCHQKHVLVSGVGNSSICEDLAQKGLASIGTDYSDHVIEMMQRRCQERQLSHLIEYSCVNMTKAHQFKDSSFKIVIDKGTLDAIISASEDPKSSAKKDGSLENAMRYLLEVSRILIIGGAMLLISNMPMDVLEQAIALCVEMKSKSDSFIQGKFHMHLDHTFTCNTDASETVYYHVLKKKDSAYIGKKDSLRMNGNKEQHSKDFVDAMLDSVKDFMENPEDYEQDNVRDESSIDMVNKVMSSNEFFKNPRRQHVDREKVDKSDLPVVELFVESQTDETIEVIYKMSDGGEVEEQDDFISIRCDPRDPDGWEIFESVPESQNSVQLPLPDRGGVYYIVYVRTIVCSDGNICVDLSEPLRISLSFSVNDYCPDDSIAFIKETCKLQKISRRRSIGTIDGTQQLSSKDSNFVSKTLSSRLKFNFVVEDLRSIKSLIITTFLICDVDSAGDHHDESVSITKVAAWRFKNIEKYSSLSTSPQIVVRTHSAANEHEITTILLEMDAVYASKNGNGKSRVETCYGLLHLSGAYVFSTVGDFEYREARGCVLEQNSLCLTIRLPYVKSQNHVTSNAADVQSKSTFSSTNPFLVQKSKLLVPNYLMLKDRSKCDISREEFTISCAFCDASIMHSTALNTVEQLPTGLFDHVMHEMMCNELPTGAITSNDLAPIPGKALIGLTHIVMNPTNLINASCLTFTCKLEPTLLEVVTSQLGVFISSTNVRSQSVLPVDISTCLIHCSRCGQYLGDAKLCGDGDDKEDESVGQNTRDVCSDEEDTGCNDGIYCQENIKDFSVFNPCCARHRKAHLLHSKSFTFLLDDTKSIKLRYDRINFRSDLENMVGYKPRICSLESMVTRSMLILAEIHRVSHFRWKISSEEGGTQIKKSNKNSTTLVIKIMNKDYLLSEKKATDFSPFPSSWSTCHAVKLQFRENDIIDCNSNKTQGNGDLFVKSGCVELPLSYDDFLDLRSTLRKRSVSLDVMHGKGSKANFRGGVLKEQKNSGSWRNSALYF